MIDKNMIEVLTLIYTHSYQVALQEVKNPELAIQIAMGVTGMIKAMDFKKESNQPQISPMDLFMATIMHGVKVEDEADPDCDK